MGFFKKLFGKNDSNNVDNNQNDSLQQNDNVKETGSNDGRISNGNFSENSKESDIEFVIHDTDDSDSVELLDDEEDEEVVPDVKSIEQIIDDVTGVIEQQENVKVEDLLGAQEFFKEKNDVNTEQEPDVSENVTAKFEEELDEAVEEELEKVVAEELEEFESTIDEDVEEAVDDALGYVVDETIEYNIEEALEEYTEEDITEVSSEDDTQAQEEVLEETQEEKKEKKSFFAKLKEGVKKTRDSIFGNINSVFNMFTTVDEDLFEELEEALILADMGVDTSLYIINELRKRVKKNGIKEVYQVRETLIDIITEILNKDETEFKIIPQTVLLVIGVNGAGKTTTIGKLSNNYIQSGYSVTVAAADTFRAAAIEQLQVWAERTGAHFIRKEEGSDPASVVFDACKSAKARNTDVLIIDTAGRLQNKKNLMEELKKINRIIDREFPEAHKEVFLVLDSTTGQNAMQQAKLFNESADITGLVLTKLDGTAKGGVIVSIKNELSVPVRYVGLGEKVDDLEPFDSKQFAKALFE